MCFFVYLRPLENRNGQRFNTLCPFLYSSFLLDIGYCPIDVMEEGLRQVEKFGYAWDEVVGTDEFVGLQLAQEVVDCFHSAKIGKKRAMRTFSPPLLLCMDMFRDVPLPRWRPFGRRRTSRNHGARYEPQRATRVTPG